MGCFCQRLALVGRVHKSWISKNIDIDLCNVYNFFPLKKYIIFENIRGSVGSIKIRKWKWLESREAEKLLHRNEWKEKISIILTWIRPAEWRNIWNKDRIYLKKYIYIEWNVWASTRSILTWIRPAEWRSRNDIKCNSGPG